MTEDMTIITLVDENENLIDEVPVPTEQFQKFVQAADEEGITVEDFILRALRKFVDEPPIK